MTAVRTLTIFPILGFCTLKDFKNATIEIYEINNFLMHQFYWDLAKLNINMSRKYD